MIRVIYLLSLPLDRRDQLIAAAVNGERWLREDLRTLVTEKEMVELAQRLTGWTFSVYKFGCAFIHLSAFHDYMNRDPLNHIAPNELADLVKHCRYYHGGPIAENPSFSDFVPFLPAVFEKIATNLEHYLEELREEKGLEHV